MCRNETRTEFWFWQFPGLVRNMLVSFIPSSSVLKFSARVKMWIATCSTVQPPTDSDKVDLFCVFVVYTFLGEIKRNPHDWNQHGENKNNEEKHVCDPWRGSLRNPPDLVDHQDQEDEGEEEETGWYDGDDDLPDHDAFCETSRATSTIYTLCMGRYEKILHPV